jgi:hypothetical protein
VPNARSYARSFVGGEVTPEFFGRFDDLKNQTGLQVCRNAIIKPHGPAANRGGLRFITKAKNPTTATAVRVLPFVARADQSVVLEVGAGYFRFIAQGAQILVPAAAAWSNLTSYAVADLAVQGGVNYYCLVAHTNQAPPNAAYWYAIPSAAYEIPHPYVADDLMHLKFIQSNDVLTITHNNYPPAELRRYGVTKWIYAPISFVSKLSPPSGVSATAVPAVTSPGTPTLQTYVVTAVTGADESAASGDS